MRPASDEKSRLALRRSLREQKPPDYERIASSIIAPLGVWKHLTRPKESEPAAEPLYHTFCLFSSGCWEKSFAGGSFRGNRWIKGLHKGVMPRRAAEKGDYRLLTEPCAVFCFHRRTDWLPLRACGALLREAAPAPARGGTGNFCSPVSVYIDKNS